MGLRGFLTTLALGAGGMYLFDPERGDQRRNELGQQFERFSRDAEDLWRDGLADLQQRMVDMREKAQNATEGGVQQVTDAARQAAGNLQQGAQGVTATGEGMQARFGGNGMTGGQMSPGPRLLAITGGSLLTLYGRTQRGLKGGAFTALGLNLLTKGVANKSLPQIVQRTKGVNLDDDKSLAIDASGGSAETGSQRHSKSERGGQSGKGQQAGQSTSSSGAASAATPRTASGGESRPMGQYGEGEDAPGNSEPTRKKPGGESGSGV
jgi:hypothetical protein